MRIVYKMLLSLTIMIIAGGFFTFADGQERNCKCGKECSCTRDTSSTTCKCKMSHSMMMSSENAFLKIMDRMMMAMEVAPLDASSEGNFLRQMIPHHEGAIEMAKYEIANGKDPQMIQLAKSILTEQQAEIAEMKAMLNLYPFKANEQASPEYSAAMTSVMQTMMEVTPTDNLLSGKSVDCAFAQVMLPHHQAAVNMAAVLLRFSPQGQVATYALRVISDQQIEIEQMAAYISKHCK